MSTSRKKIYLSKSNACDKDELDEAREMLADYDCEVVEFKGGSYSHKPMLECDYMIVVAPDMAEVKGDYNCLDKVPVGRGQYDQICSFAGRKGFNKIFYFGGDRGSLFNATDIELERDYKISSMTHNHGLMLTNYSKDGNYGKNLEDIISEIEDEVAEDPFDNLGDTLKSAIYDTSSYIDYVKSVNRVGRLERTKPSEVITQAQAQYKTYVDGGTLWTTGGIVFGAVEEGPMLAIALL